MKYYLTQGRSNLTYLKWRSGEPEWININRDELTAPYLQMSLTVQLLDSIDVYL